MATDTGKNKKTRKGWKVFLSLIVILVLSVLGVIEWQPEIFHELLQYYYAQQTEIPTQEEIAIPTESIPVEGELELHMIDVGYGVQRFTSGVGVINPSKSGFTANVKSTSDKYGTVSFTLYWFAIGY